MCEVEDHIWFPDDMDVKEKVMTVEERELLDASRMLRDTMQVATPL